MKINSPVSIIGDGKRVLGTNYVLIVDDEEELIEIFEEYFEDVYNVKTACCTDEALQIIKEIKARGDDISILVTDQQMPGGSGIDLLQTVQPMLPHTIKILTTGHQDIDTSIQAINIGHVHRYIRKPWILTEVEEILFKADQLFHQNKINGEVTTNISRWEKQLTQKQKMLSIVSHEIRTPLGSIRVGIGDLAESKHLEGERANTLEMMSSSVDYLMSLVNDMLDMAKIQSGQMTLESISFDLGHALKNFYNMFYVRTRNKPELDFQVNCSADIPTCLTGDKHRLLQILININGNAIKFTEKGYVKTDVTLLRKEENTVWLKFAVQDTG